MRVTVKLAEGVDNIKFWEGQTKTCAWDLQLRELGVEGYYSVSVPSTYLVSYLAQLGNLCEVEHAYEQVHVAAKLYKHQGH